MEITIKELVDAITDNTGRQPAEENDSLMQFVSPGDYVIVRSRNEGVNAGFLVECGIGYIAIDRARRLWYHKPADNTRSWYEGVAETGLSEDSKVSGEVKRKVIVEDYSIIPCSDVAIDSIIGHPQHEQ